MYVGAIGIMSEPVYDGFGPGVSLATIQWSHGNPGVIGGGMLANEFISTPVAYWHANWPPDVPRWGIAAKRFIRENYVRTQRIYGPIQEIPTPDARVQIDERVKDKFGIPVARLSGRVHEASVDAARFLREKSIEWLKASGAEKVWSHGVGPRGLSGGQHQAGTCRMGNDSKSSVTDAWGRVHGHDNLFVADGSLHVTNGGFNPVLTIMALAYRVGEGILR
jgi:choline dehydrogenase-like flavoprotein